MYRSPPPSHPSFPPRATASCLWASLERLPRLAESDALACRSKELVEGLTRRGGNREDAFLTTRGTPPGFLLLLLFCGIPGTDVAGPGIENVDERLVCAWTGIGSWNQLRPRVVSATSSVLGRAPDTAQGSSFPRPSNSASWWSERA